MNGKFKQILTNKYTRIIGFTALISGLVFTTWSLIPLNPTQAELDDVIKDERLVVQDKKDYIVLKSKNNVAKAGLIFYPGAKIDSRAYLYKLSALAKQDNFAVYITKPFLHYAFTDIDAAKKIVDENSDIKGWVIGGHSLGGAMACSYIKNQDQIKYLILMGSYCGDNISNSDKKVLSIVGGEDGLATSAKIDKYRNNLPKDTKYITIQGMNHAQIGNYGDQLGDKPAKSPDSYSRLKIIDAVNSFVR
jgi:Alpha/beta hydrolase family